MKSANFNSLTVFEDGTVKYQDKIKKVSKDLNNQPIIKYNGNKYRLATIMAKAFFADTFKTENGDCASFISEPYTLENLRIWNRHTQTKKIFNKAPEWFGKDVKHNGDCLKCFWLRSCYQKMDDLSDNARSYICLQHKMTVAVVGRPAMPVQCSKYKEEPNKIFDPPDWFNIFSDPYVPKKPRKNYSIFDDHQKIQWLEDQRFLRWWKKSLSTVFKNYQQKEEQHD